MGGEIVVSAVTLFTPLGEMIELSTRASVFAQHFVQKTVFSSRVLPHWPQNLVAILHGKGILVLPIKIAQATEAPIRLIGMIHKKA